MLIYPFLIPGKRSLHWSYTIFINASVAKSLASTASPKSLMNAHC